MNALAQAMARALLQRGQVRAVELFVRDGDQFSAAALQLRDAGFSIVPSKPGVWSLAHPFCPLSESDVRAALGESAAAALETLQIDVVSASTNADALSLEPPAAGRYHALLAEFQWAGKGRRGAQWLSPPGGGLCLSVVLRLPRTRGLSTFSLACGVSVQKALTEAGVPDVQLKWPNDVVVNGRKLGGLLVQARQETDGTPVLVVGLGLNVSAVPASVDADAMTPIALKDVSNVAPRTRSALAGSMIETLWDAGCTFAADGFAPFDSAWRAADFLHGREVRVRDHRSSVHGVARGVNDSGELLVETAGGVQIVNAGEVSVRPVGHV